MSRDSVRDEFLLINTSKFRLKSDIKNGHLALEKKTTPVSARERILEKKIFEYKAV